MKALQRLRKRLLPDPPARTREEILALLAAYMGEEQVAKLGEAMPLRQAGSLRAPEKILFILFASRAGSSYAGRLLANTPHFRYVAEAFKPIHLEEVRRREGFAWDDEAAQWMIDNWGSERAFGMKAGFKVLAGAAHLGFLPDVVERAQFVLLRRRDRIAQAVSLFKGNISGRMHSVQKGGREVSADEYDAEAIAHNVAHIARNERYFEEIVGRLGKEAPTLYYEDICAAPRAFVERICRLLDLPPPAEFSSEVDLEVMRDDVSREWIERFREEHPEAA